MRAYPSKADTLTSQNIVDAFRSAYVSATGEQPTECRHIQGRWFMINGFQRDREWLLLEVERLRQEALAKTLESAAEDNSRSRIFRMIRKLSRI